MQTIVGITLAAVMALASSASHARGPAPSSFAPRGPEPHSTLANKHGTQRSSHKNSHGNATGHKRVASHSTKSN
jgi:hypothetical protein